MATSRRSSSSLAVTREQAQAVLARYQNNPLLFDREVLGRDSWDIPRAVMAAIAQPRSRVAVKACHGSSKTFSAAGIILWWVYTGGVALTTAPTGTQVKAGVWAEIHKAYHGARVPLGGQLNQKELRVSADCYALGLSTNQGVRFQGFHGRVLIVLDEAPGVLTEIWPAISGIRAGGDVRLLVLGNPVIPSGPFYDAFTSKRAGWQTFTISAFDTPNLRGVTADDLEQMSPEELAYEPRPYLVTRQWVLDMLRDEGRDSADYQARVLGQFPTQAADSLLSLAWLETAQRDEVPSRADTLWAGVDVAGPGEAETVLTVRQGPVVLPGFPMAWSAADPRGAVVAALLPFRDADIQVNVDSIGIGYNFARHLEDQGFTVHDVNVGLPALDKEKYANSKAEYYWGLRQRLAAGDMAGLLDEQTIGQLSGIRYKHNARGQIVIESKDDAAKRGVPSPDRAESVMLAFARPPQGVVEVDDDLYGDMVDDRGL